MTRPNVRLRKATMRSSSILSVQVFMNLPGARSCRQSNWLRLFVMLSAPTQKSSLSCMVASHNVGGPGSTAAALHFAACTPNFKIQEHFNDFAEDWVKAAAPGNPGVVEGYFALPQGPGLGIKLNEEVIREHPQQQIFFNLFAENWHRRQAQRSS